MKKLITFLTALTFFSCATREKSGPNMKEDYQIIPKPANMTFEDGRFQINDETKISGIKTLQTEGGYLAEMLSMATGNSINFITATGQTEAKTGNTINLSISDTISNTEGYVLSVTPEAVTIAGKSSKGVFYGIQTLRQLLPAEVENKKISDLSIPAVTIVDQPRYAYRGMHLDVCRHFFPVSFIKKYIDLLAMHKLNTFHWHLTDDQGWRMEIKQYPELTKVGAYRNGTIVGHYPGTQNDNERYGGFYTQEEAKEVIAYAKAKHITVIPEIELPGHASAAIAAYPYLSCFPNEPTVIPEGMISEKGKELQEHGTPKIVQESWGVFPDVFCAGKDSTFVFLDNVIDEVIDVFPSEYIHIGGDECPKDNWKRCPACQARIKKLNLKDEHGLQSYFVQRIEKHVNKKGRKIIGWDEILEGGLAPNATVMSWRGEEGGIEAAKQDHDVIMTPTTYLYFDYYQFKDPLTQPLGIGGYVSLEKVYGYNPDPKELTKAQHKYILGAQANIWTEYIATPEHLEFMVLPRLAALSEVDWTPQADRDFADFKKRLGNLEERYQIMGINYGRENTIQREEE